MQLRTLYYQHRLTIFWSLILIVLLLASIWFFKLPNQNTSISVGSYVLSSFPSGLALYAGPGAQQYYSISPLNDYFITSDGYRVALLSGDSYNSKQFQESIKTTQAQRLLQSIVTYFDITAPSYALRRSAPVIYTSKQISSDTIELTKEINIPENRTAITTATTLTFDDQDYVYSPNTGSLFTQHSEQEIAWLEKHLGHTITQASIPEEYQNTRLFTWEIDANKVVIMNPAHAGYIVVKTNINQSLLVNPKDHLIEIIETLPPSTKTYTSVLTIQVLAEPPN